MEFYFRNGVCFNIIFIILFLIITTIFFIIRYSPYFKQNKYYKNAKILIPIFILFLYLSFYWLRYYYIFYKYIITPLFYTKQKNTNEILILLQEKDDRYLLHSHSFLISKCYLFNKNRDIFLNEKINEIFNKLFSKNQNIINNKYSEKIKVHQYKNNKFYFIKNVTEFSKDTPIINNLNTKDLETKNILINLKHLKSLYENKNFENIKESDLKYILQNEKYYI